MGFMDAPAVSKADVVKIAGTQVGSARGKDWRRAGAVTTDITSIVQSATPDATLNQQYLLANSSAIPSTYPVDFGVGVPKALTNSFGYAELEYPLFGGTIKSLVTDAPKIAIKFGYATANYAYQVFIDGAPVSADPVVGNGGLYLTIVFPSGAKSRLIEINTRSGIGSIYVAKPYRVWKPAPAPSPKILVMGDSYAQTTSYDDSGNSLPGEYGIYHRMRADLGVANLGVDGVGGSGYIRKNSGGIGGPDNNYLDRLPSALALAPDVLIAHGGGANDLYYGSTVSEIVAQATTFFQTARASLPNAKLVFVEGFSPSVGFSTFNDEYIAIRQALQSALTTVGVYYVDVATTSPWIDGTGYYGATTGVGNGDIYIGPDGVHLTAKGSSYIRSRMADKMRLVLADNGTKVNQLI